MSLTPYELDLNSWAENAPSLCGIPAQDCALLGDYVAGGRRLLELLPAKPRRSAQEALQARRIHDGCRAMRRRFLNVHSEWLYADLTQNFSVRLDLREVAFAAAERCPGLAPTAAEMAEEQARVQQDKEGLEIDQGLLFHRLLRVPRIGLHLIESLLRPTLRALQLSDGFRRAGRLDLGSVSIERRGRVAHVTLNNAFCLNAEDDRLIEDMETAIDIALLDRDVFVGVLRGGVMGHPRYRGRRVFSAGINLKALHAGKISFVDFFLRRELGYIHKIVRGLIAGDEMDLGRVNGEERSFEKPWLAAVDGFAIGGGAQLLLAVDRVVASSDSYFSLPAAQEGIIPGFAALRLTRASVSRKARDLILCGGKISARDADASLLVDEVVDPGEMDDAINRNADQLCAPAVVANRHMLNLAEEPIELLVKYASEFALCQSERLYCKDVLENVGRFSKVGSARQAGG